MPCLRTKSLTKKKAQSRYLICLRNLLSIKTWTAAWLSQKIALSKSPTNCPSWLIACTRCWVESDSAIYSAAHVESATTDYRFEPQSIGVFPHLRVFEIPTPSRIAP
ncbi:hypothetical protein O181_035357 [Austropuccinia psidii MF-1]|uniref:Uncharacterized protein n=1 Tax=Austropuccinia psidii MF-1 TaxID=1389203 RepID=A0A9Q3H8X6_9BASI|nr:hypothetical protein [Austropuccinia psidii MF-1]